MKTIVLGLGNTVLRDDGIGIFVARELRKILPPLVAVVEAELAGFDLLGLLEGYDRAVIIDAIQLNDVEPGTVFRILPDDIKTTPRLASFHDIDLVTAIALGKRMGLTMPFETVIYAVQALDTVTLEEGCTEQVERIIPLLAREIAGELEEIEFTRISKPLAAREGKSDA